MIESRSILNVADNTVVRTARCIGAKKNSRRIRTQLGDCILVSVQSVHKTNDILVRGIKIFGVLVRLRKHILTKEGISVIFKENSIVLVSNKGNPLATRILGPVPDYLRLKGYRKFFSIGATSV